MNTAHDRVPEDDLHSPVAEGHVPPSSILPLPLLESPGRKRSLFFIGCCCLLFSLLLHGVTLAAIWFLGSRLASDGGLPDGSPQVISVSLSAGSGVPCADVDKSPAEAGETQASAAEDSQAPAPAQAEPEPQSKPTVQEEVPCPPVPEKPRAEAKPEKQPAEKKTAPAIKAEPKPVAVQEKKQPRPKKQQADKTRPRETKSATTQTSQPERRKKQAASATAEARNTPSQRSAKTDGTQGGGAGAGSPRTGSPVAAGTGSGAPSALGQSSSEVSGRAAAQGYLKGNYEYIKKRVRRYLVYSQRAKRMGIEGQVMVSFTIQKDGSVQKVVVSASSGHSSLDEAAVAAVNNAAPFAPPPHPAHITIPIQFRLK